MSHSSMRRPQIPRNYSMVDIKEAFDFYVMPEPNSGCWLWIGPILKQRGGYGCFTAGEYVMARAHRVSWELSKNVILKKHEFVLHSCDNPVCVNPDHLFLGTQANNMRDMGLKGRQAQGVNHSQYKHGRYIGQKKNHMYP